MLAASSIENHRTAKAAAAYAAPPDILRDLAVEAGATAVVGGVLSVFTAGLTGAAATAAITARAAVFGGRIIKVLEKLKTAVRLGALVRTGSAGTKVKAVGPVLKRVGAADRAERRKGSQPAPAQHLGRPRVAVQRQEPEESRGRDW
ncbi:hypothetical protein KG112_14215 [Nocardioides sp. zg-ZUI104]|uniref:hypothetical protein n=1 Tax=Nocardioides faecalis TaxID=2803858 RepID=UPI001BCF0CAE|nr:hypothetical protein [Nocardioides faecalis]MBS4753964.1 hypothetical protein [Nocardioides faecalis]